MTEDVKETEEESSASEKTVPYERFKSVNEAKKEAEQELQALKGQQTGSLTPEQQKEKQAKDFLKGLVREELKAEEEARKAAETKEQKEFNNSVDEQLAVNPKVNRDDFLKFIEKNSEKYGISGVPQAMQLYKDLGKIKDDTTEEVKENLSKKPNLPKSAGTGDTTPDYSDDKDKTYEQIVAEIISEAEAKGQK